MDTFYQPHQSEHRWTKAHPLSQVLGNPSKPVQTRRQLVTNPEMCMFALTVSTAKPKTIKEAMSDSAWIEAIQEEFHQFDRLQVWELVDKPFRRLWILTANTPYPSRKIRCIRACTHQRPRRKQDLYVVSRENQYAVLKI
ncbi:hypothetical protein Tco_1252252 [Tanacetum coccineum]